MGYQVAGGTEEFAGTGASASLSFPPRPGSPLPGRAPSPTARDAHHDNLRLIVRPPAFSCEALHAWMGRSGGLDATFQPLTLLGLGQPQLALQQSDSLTRLRSSLQISHTLSERPNRPRLCARRAGISTSLRLRLLGDGSPLVSAARLISRESPRLDVPIASAARLCATRTFQPARRAGERACERARASRLRKRFRLGQSPSSVPFACEVCSSAARAARETVRGLFEARPLAPRLALSLSRHASTPLLQSSARLDNVAALLSALDSPRLALAATRPPTLAAAHLRVRAAAPACARDALG